MTGSHNVKVGYQGSYQKSAQGRVANQTQLEYRFIGRTLILRDIEAAMILDYLPNALPAPR